MVDHTQEAQTKLTFPTS